MRELWHVDGSNTVKEKWVPRSLVLDAASALRDAEAYFEDRADASDGIPNDEMQLLNQIREVLAKVAL